MLQAHSTTKGYITLKDSIHDHFSPVPDGRRKFRLEKMFFLDIDTLYKRLPYGGSLNLYADFIK